MSAKSALILTSPRKRGEVRPSKRRDGIRGRTRAAANRERRRCQQEIPALPVGRRICQRLEIAVVEEMYAEIQEREIMNGAAQVRWRDVLRMIAAQDGDVALLEPGDHRGIKPCRPPAFGTAAKPWPNLLTPRPHTRAHE